MGTLHEPPAFRQIALYVDEDGRTVTQPVMGVGDVPQTIERAGRVLTLRMIHHVPTAAAIADAEATAARRRAWNARHVGSAA